MTQIYPAAPQPGHTRPQDTHDMDPARASLREAAQQLEISFAAEMLKSAGLGQPRESFGGGAGETGFASFLANAQAEQIVRSGGFGLTEQIFRALVQAETGHD